MVLCRKDTVQNHHSRVMEINAEYCRLELAKLTAEYLHREKEELNEKRYLATLTRTRRTKKHIMPDKVKVTKIGWKTPKNKTLILFSGKEMSLEHKPRCLFRFRSDLLGGVWQGRIWPLMSHKTDTTQKKFSKHTVIVRLIDPV